LLATQSLGRLVIRLVHERDDAPHARRRAEQSIEQLRAGSPVLPTLEPPPPPPVLPLTPQKPLSRPGSQTETGGGPGVDARPRSGHLWMAALLTT
jgi:hypothetical protein